jgi:hypothetical protein
MTVRVILVGVPWSGNTRKRRHHYALYRHDRVWKEATFLSARNELIAHRGESFPFDRAAVRITLFVKSRSHVRDEDNAVASVKPILDGLTGVVIVDDNPDRITLSVATVVDRDRGPSVRVEVDRVE